MSVSTFGWDEMTDWWDTRMGDEGDLWHRALIDPPLLRLVGDVAGGRLAGPGGGDGFFCRPVSGPGGAPGRGGGHPPPLPGGPRPGGAGAPGSTPYIGWGGDPAVR